MSRVLAVLLALISSWAFAQDAQVSVCYNYGCSATGTVVFESGVLAKARASLLEAGDAVAERAALAVVVGGLYLEAGRQTPIAADRGGNFLDQEVEGRMDCIDHSTTTTRFLTMMADRGMLRFHRVLEPARRTRFILQHFSAVIEERAPPPGLQQAVVVPDHVPLMLALCDCAEVLGDVLLPPALPAPMPGARFAVDSWFVDNGEAAVVLPLADWLDGDGPNVQ
ncbi:hypothetical protein J5J83_20605 [Azoarcus sp. L1K30]|uniref:hypothetical protein n=1 Tax=Azoarcus sp. L1K30 TaxID=2820277 RepID=UPI001B83826E|nr:hypothetical protein [Azoarcus sp. L1K30]MBR0568532.1 hypothetical protein [Azoarcus sp. L1K30]